MTSSAAPALLLCQNNSQRHERARPRDFYDDDEEHSLPLGVAKYMTFADFKLFFDSLMVDHVRPPAIAKSPTTDAAPVPAEPQSPLTLPYQLPRRFKIVTHHVRIGAVVSAKWIDNEFYPAIVLQQCCRNVFEVRYLADGIFHKVNKRNIHANPKFGMCPRDERVWDTGLVKTFNNRQYRF